MFYVRWFWLNRLRWHKTWPKTICPGDGDEASQWLLNLLHLYSKFINERYLTRGSSVKPQTKKEICLTKTCSTTKAITSQVTVHELQLTRIRSRCWLGENTSRAMLKIALESQLIWFTEKYERQHRDLCCAYVPPEKSCLTFKSQNFRQASLRRAWCLEKKCLFLRPLSRWLRKVIC